MTSWFTVDADGVIIQVWRGRNPKIPGTIATEEPVAAGMLWQNGQMEMPEPDLDRLEAAARAQWSATVAAARAEIAGTSDPAKLAEYADKAANAEAVIDGTAPAEIMAEAQAEADSLGLDDAGAVALLWLEKAAALRIARTAVNALDRQQRDAISRRRSADGYEEALGLAGEALDTLLAGLTG